MYIWGKNNNYLIKQNHKKTYSLPQKIPIKSKIYKCAPGFDYIFFIKEKTSTLYCYFQSAIIKFEKFTNIIDIGSTDNMIVLIDSDNKGWITQFNAQKITRGELNPTNINFNKKIQKIFVDNGDIFLISSNNIYHLKRNQWYQTKTYTDPIQLKQLSNKNIIKIASGIHLNYFLTKEGYVYTSKKNDPTAISQINSNFKFKDISAGQYMLSIGVNGRIYVYGQVFHQYYSQPTQFGKIAQKFINVNISSQNAYAITENGQCWVWGKNSSGQLGLSDYEPRNSPYPLITLQSQYIKNIYIGQGFVVGCIDTQKKIKGQFKKKNISYQNLQQNDVISFELKGKSNKQNILQDKNQFSRVNISNINDNINKKKTIKPIQIKQTHRNHAITSYTPKKHILQNKGLSQRSKSPTYSAKQRSSISKSKSPRIDNSRLRSLSNNLNRQSLIILQNRKQMQKRIKYLQQQNSKLQKLLQNRQQVIEDITCKIRLLQDAIQQHQRTLTARDNMVQNHYKKQKQYLVHIDELQKTIQALIKGKSNVQPIDFIVNSRVNQLKYEFQLQRQVLTNKINQYQNKLNSNNVQKTQYRINQTFGINTESISSKQKSNQNNKVEVEKIISKIEDSKQRIGKSANKLIKLLGQTQ